ncbi:hypothetical protein MK280_06005, partial [Myxococcota bacterium]|nr:hypothetical protein [Myxococcota bacterium]
GRGAAGRQGRRVDGESVAWSEAADGGAESASAPSDLARAGMRGKRIPGGGLELTNGGPMSQR